MEFRVLGSLEALADDGAPLRVGAGKPRALLALLLLEANRVVPASRLVDGLWGDDPPETATTALQVYVSGLRKVLPPDRLLTRPPGYLLRVEPDELDLDRFERLVADARAALAAGDAEEARTTLDAALALWRGPPLADVAGQPFAPPEAARLEELRAAALEDRVDAALAAGQAPTVVPELEALVARNPLRERPRAQLMLALYRSGRQADALAEFHAARRTLRDELGIEPGPALRELNRMILEQAPELDVQPAGRRRPAHEAAATVAFAVAGPAGGAAEEAHAVRALLLAVEGALTEELEAAGAAVAPGLAGAVLATFASEPGSALHAVLAARSRLAARFGRAVAARFGVETGTILAAGPGDPVTGAPVATAARLAGAARPGEILVGPRAAAASRGAFELRVRDDYEVVVGPR